MVKEKQSQVWGACLDVERNVGSEHRAKNMIDLRHHLAKEVHQQKNALASGVGVVGRREHRRFGHLEHQTRAELERGHTCEITSRKGPEGSWCVDLTPTLVAARLC